MRSMRRRLAVAVFTAFAASATAAPPDPNTAYKDLVAAYAAGNRAAAVAGVGDLDEDAIRSGVESLAQHPPRTLLAAVMLHTDRRLIARRFIDAPETRPACESAHTEPAWRTAEHMLLRTDAVDYARRWAVAVALQDHWDGCFEDAVRFIDNAARWFPADAGVLLARGAIYETIATLPVQVPRSGIASTAGTKLAVAVAAHERTRLLAEARRSLERALAIDPRLDAARLRLGRILWRAG